MKREDNVDNLNEVLESALSLPIGLNADVRRQAVPSIRGTVYQAWWSIDAWLQLADAERVIFLEGAEDFDVVRSDSAIAVQVRATSESISLGSDKVRGAIEHFWTLASREPDRIVDFHYLTTSSVSMERGGGIEGLRGIEAWRAAQTNVELANNVATYLVNQLEPDSPLRAFLISASGEIIQERLLRRFQWLTSQPNLEAVKRSVNDRIVEFLSKHGGPRSLVADLRMRLEARFWELILEPSSDKRVLTHAELLRQLDHASTVTLTVPIEHLQDLLVPQRPGASLLDLLLQAVPKPPAPLLRRAELVSRLTALVNQRRFVLLSGTVHKGKTTLAQLVLAALAAESAWISVTEQEPRQVSLLLLELARRAEHMGEAAVIVIDDLDVSEGSHRVYKTALEILLHRCRASGRALVITAQGASGISGAVRDFDDVDLLEVNEMDPEETAAHCVEHGCPSERAAGWGALLSVSTLGHPKLVQIRIGELVAHGWPAPNLTDLTKPSTGVNSAKQIARRLLADSVSLEVAEFIYVASECSTLMHRSVALRLIESVVRTPAAGDVLDSLVGKWLECVESDWFRVTALLRGVAGDVWTPERRQHAHSAIHDALLARRTMSPAEAAAMLFHAYFSTDRRRIAMTAMQLQLIDDDAAKREVDRQLIWFPLAALEEGQRLTDDAVAEAALRSLQFRVATTLDTESTSSVCLRWVEAINRIAIEELKVVCRATMWLSFTFSLSQRIGIELRLAAAAGLPTLPPEIATLQESGLEQMYRSEIGSSIPANVTIAQVALLPATRAMTGLESLARLLRWLDTEATADLRSDFESVLEWPVVQDAGAFVQTAWAATHESTKDWESWLELFCRIEDYAARRRSPAFGREAAKARAIVLTEYLSRAEDALVVLQEATEKFGPSTVILEQRANVLYNMEDDAAVLELWDEVTDRGRNVRLLDPFAHRRAAVSAARLKRWNLAEEIFRAAVDIIPPGSMATTKFGLEIDVVLARLRAGNKHAALDGLIAAIEELPQEASQEGDPRWEAVLRVAGQVCQLVEDELWVGGDKPVVEPGQASSPNLCMFEPQPGQAARHDLTRAQALRLAATVTSNPRSVVKALRRVQEESKFFAARWSASCGALACSFADGAGDDFVPALVAFERATVEFIARRTEGLLLQADDGPDNSFPIEPQRWFGLIAAGLACQRSDVATNLGAWLEHSVALLGDDAALTELIRQTLEGVRRASLDYIREEANSSGGRCAAAAKMLSVHQPVGTCFQLQQFLVSGAVSDLSILQQHIFNRHVARSYAARWRVLSDARYHFEYRAPRRSVLHLVATIERVECGEATLGELMAAARDAIGAPGAEFMERVN